MNSIIKSLGLCLLLAASTLTTISFAQEVSDQQLGSTEAVPEASTPAPTSAPTSVPTPAPDGNQAVMQQNPASAPVPAATETLPVLAAQAPLEAPSRASKDAICTSCHDENSSDPILAIYQTQHGVKADPRTPACQSCHGDSAKHLRMDPGQTSLAAPDVVFGSKSKASEPFPPSDVTVQNEACLSCHRRDANRSHWEGSIHQRRDVACVACHEIHAAHDKVREKLTQPEVCFTCHKEQRAQINKPSHHPIAEGKMTCTDCHNPHGSVGPKLMKRDSVNDTCYTCHMEKRGPFVHNHEPVSEDCSTCHNPHGTTAESMLKMRPPFLCNSCHTPHAPVQPVLAGQSTPSLNSLGWWNGVAATQGRGCLNCHSQVHGSNNPGFANPASQNLFR